MGAAGALLVLSALSGCGFMTDLADPVEPPVRAEDPAPVGVVPAVGTPAPDQPRVIASGQLRTTSGPGLPQAVPFELAFALHADDGTLFTSYRRRT